MRLLEQYCCRLVSSYAIDNLPPGGDYVVTNPSLVPNSSPQNECASDECASDETKYSTVH